MASSIDYMECKQCGGIVYNELNCNTLEEWQRCERCGCGFNYEAKRDKKGKLILNKKKRPKYRFKRWNGYGVIHFCFKNGNGVSYHLHKALSKRTKKSFFLELENNVEIDKEKSYLMSWDKKQKKIVSVYGKIPPTFEDWEKSYNEKNDKEEESLCQ